MGHGLQERRFQGVTLPRDLGVGRLRREPVALERPAQLIGRGREQAPLRHVRQARGSCPDGPQRAEGPAVGFDDDPEDRQILASVTPTRPRLVDADPLGRTVAGGPAEHHMRGGHGARHIGRGVGDDRLALHQRPQSQPQPIHPGRARQAFEQPRGGIGDAPRRGQDTADPEHHLGLGGPGRRLVRAGHLQRGEPADDERHEQEHQQRQPLDGVADREREARLREQEVVRQEAGDGRDRRRPGAGQDGRGDDGEQVDVGRMDMQPCVEADRDRGGRDEGATGEHEGAREPGPGRRSGHDPGLASGASCARWMPYRRATSPAGGEPRRVGAVPCRAPTRRARTP